MPNTSVLGVGTALMRRLRLSAKLGLSGGLAVAVFAVVAGLVWAGADAGTLLWTLALGAALVLYLMLAFYASFMADFRQIMVLMAQTAEGNLRARTTLKGQDEVADMAALTERMVLKLSSMVADVRSNAALVADAGRSLTTGNRELADRTEQQAANLEQTAASVEEMSSTVQDNANTAQTVDVRAVEVRDLAEAGARAMGQAVQSVEAIQQSSRRMREIIGVIDGIAFQTNILALNAAVEAARAGDQGRGFAVVATEVRTLAQRSATAAKEIHELISLSGEQVESSVGLIRGAGVSMGDVVSGIRSVASHVSQISKSSAQQSAGLREITTAVQQLDGITQRNAQMVERAVEQAQNLEGRASTLAKAVSLFQLQQGTAEEAVALVWRAVALRRRVPQDAFLRSITDKSQGFHDRDMYVFVLDANGTYLAFAGNPAKVNTRVQDIPGIDGNRLLQAIMDQAELEPGWVEYDITNPASGKVQTKMSFVHAIDKRYVGCGVYKALA